MNNITKKSFWLFLTLYLSSSFIFLITSAYWFYTSQVSIQKNSDYYQLTHIADQVSSEVIKAQMMNHPLKIKKYKNATVSLYTKDKKLRYGTTITDIDFSKDYYIDKKVSTVVSQGSANHLGIKYVVVQSMAYANFLEQIKSNIIFVTSIITIFIIIIAVILAKIFLRPIKEKIEEVEKFVKDTTHELNTPITALLMSTSRANSKKTYDEKIIQNISISTKQLYEIYSSLSYLSFEVDEEDEDIKFDKVLKESIGYFDEILDKKKITLNTNISTCHLHITPTKAKMLINNLLSNAIKYSHPKTTISIYLSQEKFIISDEGVGIKKEKLKDIFKRFNRASNYAGGFGVGLNIVDDIIKKYNYKIDIDSKLQKGTKITISFL